MSEKNEFEDMDANEIVKYILENVDSMTDKKIEALGKKVNEMLEEGKKEVNENEEEKEIVGHCEKCGVGITKKDILENDCKNCGNPTYR